MELIIKERRIVEEGSDKVCCNCIHRQVRGANSYCDIDGHYMGYCDVFDNLCEHWEDGDKTKVSYKGYITHLKYSDEDRVWYGKIDNITDLVNFESGTLVGVIKEFYKAVNEYIKIDKNKFEVIWNGTDGSSLCVGEWKIYKNNEDVSYLIPEELRDIPMGTYGIYEEWEIGEDNLEQWEEYEDGLVFEDWIKENDCWVSKICDNNEEKKELYDLINKVDFRPNSCGGCL